MIILYIFPPVLFGMCFCPALYHMLHSVPETVFSCTQPKHVCMRKRLHQIASFIYSVDGEKNKVFNLGLLYQLF